MKFPSRFSVLFDGEHNKALLALAMALAILISWFGIYYLGRTMMLGDNGAIRYLDESRANINTVTVLSAGTATALALVPEDSTTPVANQIAGIAGRLIIASVVLTIEEIIAKIAPAICFRILIPIAFVLFFFYHLKKRKALRDLALKLIALSLVLIMFLPMAAFVNREVDNVLGLDQRIKDLHNETSNVVVVAEEYSEQIEESGAQEAEKKGFFQSIGDWISGAANDVGNAVSGAVNTVVHGAANLLKKAEDLYSKFMAAVVAMLLTDVVIPTAILVLMYKIVKWLFISKFRIADDLEKKFTKWMGKPISTAVAKMKKEIDE